MSIIPKKWITYNVNLDSILKLVYFNDMKTLLFIILSVVAVTAQPSNFADVKAQVDALNDKQMFVDYNKFSESVTVGARPSGIVASCFAVKPKTGAPFTGVILERSGKEWEWLSVSSFRFIADETRGEWKDGTRRSQITSSRYNVTVYERLLFAPTDAQFEQLFNAKTAELQISFREYAIPPKVLTQCSTALKLAKTLL